MQNIPAMTLVEDVVIRLALVAVVKIGHLPLSEADTVAVLPHLALVTLNH